VRSETARTKAWVVVSVAAFAAVAATSALGGSVGDTIATEAAVPGAAAPKPTLSVAVLGSGSVASKPAGISCPRTCVGTFAAGSRVLLTPKAKSGSRFLRWGGSCTGTGTCRVRVSALAAVAAQFGGPKTQPQPPVRTSAVEPGSYRGSHVGGHPVTFFVSAGGASVLNISIPTVFIACTPAGGFPSVNHLEVLKTAIETDGSFTAKASQDGVFAGVKAKFTYSVNGQFQQATAGKAATAAGTYRQEIVFTDSTAHRCTSNNQSWTASRTGDPQPPRKSLIEPGSYRGSHVGGHPITFSVAAGGASALNISIPTVFIACTPAGAFPSTDHLQVLKTAINADGSFTAKTTQDGVFAGKNAKFTYFFTGHFQGVTAAGVATASGVYRQDIVFTDATTRTCTSNNQTWTATRR
jgi:hypothetical protein